MRRVARVVAALGIAAFLGPPPVLAQPSADSPSRAQGWLEETLSAAVGGEVRFGTFSWSITDLSADFTEFSVSVPVEGAPPLAATAASGRIRLAWSGVAGLFGGRVRIAELVLVGPRFETTAATVDALARRPSKGRAVEVEVARVEIRDGRLRYTDADDGLDISLGGVSFRGVWDAYRRAIVGPVEARGELLRSPITRTLAFRTRGTVRVSPRSLEFVGIEATSEGMSARLDGRLLLRGQVAFAAEARTSADLAALGAHLDPAFPRLAGSGSATLRIDKGGPGFVVRGRATVSEALLAPLRAEAASAAFTLRPGILEIRDLDAEAYGGRASGGLDVILRDPVRIRTTISGAGLDAAPLLALAGLDLPVAARADGAFEIEGEPGAPATWRGRARFVAARESPSRGRVPASADGEIVFEEGHARIAAARVDLAAASLVLGLDADLGTKPVAARVTLAGRTKDAAATHAATLTFMDALGVEPPAVARETLSGAGAIAATIDIGPRPGLGLDLELAEVSWSGERFDRAALVLRYDGSTVAIERLEAGRGEEWLEARIRFGPDGEIEEVDAAAAKLSASSVLSRAGVAADVSGRLAGELKAARTDGALVGEGRFALTEATVYGESVDEASGPVAVEGGLARIAPLAVRGPGVDATATVAVSLEDGSVSGSLTAAEFRPAQSTILDRSGLRGEGVWKLSGPFRWTAQGPGAELTVTGHGVAVGKADSELARLAMGEARGTLTLTPEAALVDLADGAGARWSATARVGRSADAPVEATVRLRDVELEVAAAEAGSTEIDLSGEVRVRGPLARPEEIVVEGELGRVTARFGPTALTSAEPISLRFSAGRFETGAAVLRDEGSLLEARVAFVPAAGEIEADLSGTLDLSVLNAVAPGFRGSGSAVFAFTVRGTAEAPRLDGRLTVGGARLRVPGFPQPLDDIVLAVRLENARAIVESFEAQCGGGELRGTGSATFADGRIASYEGTLDVARVSVPFPEGFRGVYEGQLRLEGSPRLGRLSGRLAMIRGLYGEDIDILSLLASSSRQILPDDESVLPRNVLLDVSVDADGNVWMRNNLGTVETRVDLAVGGTMARPELTGRLELFEGGKFRFRDVEYRIESGTIELADPRQIRPLLDLRGTTRVKDVEIDLHVEGPADRIRYELTSNPPLSEQDIIGILLTGRTFEDATAFGGTAGFTGDVAANYFAGALTARLGRQLGKALGLDRLQIDPLIVENGADPTTRVTVGKQLGPRVGFLYATTLGATKDQSYQLEWDMSRRLQFLAETTTDAGVGGDLRYRDRFGGEKAARPGSKGRSASAGAVRVASVVITGVPAEMSVRLGRRLTLAAGSPYSRAALYEGSDALRRALVEEGHIQSRVEARVTGVGEVSVSYDVELGPEVSVRIEGSGWRDRRRQTRKLQRFWENSLYSSDLYVEGEEILLRDVQLRGYFAADVDHDHAGAGEARREVVYHVDRGEKVRVKSIRILGASGVPEARLRAQMLTRAGGLSFGRRVLDPLVLEDDVRAIRALYRNEGYLGVRVQGPLLRLSPEGDEATVTLTVEEGRRWVVGRVDVPTDRPFPAESIRAWSGLRPGSVFSPAAILEAEGAIRANLDRAGYPEAVVEAVYTLADDVANVSLEVAAGPLKRIRSVEIVGNRRTKEKIIRRELGFATGDPVSRERLLEAQQRLYRLGIFRSVRLDDGPIEGDDPSARVVKVDVQETAPIGFSLGPGYDSETGARLSFSLSHDNLGGYDRSVALQGRWSDSRKRLQIVGREPRLFNRPLTGLAAFFWEREAQSGFTIERRSTALRVERKLDRRWTRYLRYNFQRVDVTLDPTVTTEQIEDLLRQRLTNVRLGDVGFAFVRDTRDDPFLTTRGGYASADLRVFAKPFISDEAFVKLSVGGSLTRTFPRGTSFSVALRFGLAEPMGSTQTVPLSERFFAGGESTVRGYSRDALGPSFSDLTGTPGLENVPLGGEALFVVNEEWRVPLWRSLRGVLFLDAGNVFLTLPDFDVRDVRESAGLGLRYDTPIGPLRVEYGWKLDRRDGESPGQFHLAIGSVF